MPRSLFEWSILFSLTWCMMWRLHGICLLLTASGNLLKYKYYPETAICNFQGINLIFLINFKMLLPVNDAEICLHTVH